MTVESLSQVRVAVAADTDPDTAKKALLRGIALRIEDAGSDPVKLKTLVDELNAQSRPLAVAVHANVPSKRAREAEKAARDAARKKAQEEQAALESEQAERTKADEALVVEVRAIATKLDAAKTDPAKLEALTGELMVASGAPAPAKAAPVAPVKTADAPPVPTPAPAKADDTHHAKAKADDHAKAKK